MVLRSAPVARKFGSAKISLISTGKMKLSLFSIFTLSYDRLTKAHKRAVSGEEERAGKGSEVTGKKLKLSK